MIAEISVKMESDAFAGGFECNELIRILRDLADKIDKDDSVSEMIVHGGIMKLRDVNGNVVGKIRVI